MGKVTIVAQGVEVDRTVRSAIEKHSKRALGPFGRFIGHVHVRLYKEPSGASPYICHIRVGLLPSGGVARGEAALELEGAVAAAAASVRATVGREFEKTGRREARTWRESIHSEAWTGR
jgi:hypothetical protein